MQWSLSAKNSTTNSNSNNPPENNMTRKYSDIWEALKAQSHVTLAVPIPLHKRVIKGVINTKDRDVIFKFECSEKKRDYRIEYISEQSRIRIFLREFIKVAALTVDDL